jgi:hypothetical protein
MKKKTIEELFNQQAEQNNEKNLSGKKKERDELSELMRNYKVHTEEEDDFAGY